MWPLPNKFVFKNVFLPLEKAATLPNYFKVTCPSVIMVEFDCQYKNSKQVQIQP